MVMHHNKIILINDTHIYAIYVSPLYPILIQLYLFNL